MLLLGSPCKLDVTDLDPTVPTSQNAPYPILGTGRERLTPEDDEHEVAVEELANAEPRRL